VGVAREGLKAIGSALAGALWCAYASAAACPDEAARISLRDQAERAMQAGASLDAAYGPGVREARACGEPEAEAWALRDWAEAARRHGLSERLVAIEQQRVAFAARHGLPLHEAEARLQLGLSDVARGDLEPARVHLEAALDRFRALGDVTGQARLHTELSRLERRRGDYLAALRFELAGLELRRRLQPPPELWRSLLNLAVLYEQIELFSESRRHYAEALAEAERDATPEQVADVLNGYAGFLNDFGGEESQVALGMAERALDIHRRRGDRARIGSCLLQVGRARLGLGQLDAAEVAFAEALDLAHQGGFEALQAHVDFRWGELVFARGDAAGALRRIERARAQYERQGNRHRLIKVHGALERVHAALGDPLAAALAGREHFRLRNELLGANATGKLGELLTNFALADAQHRNERLQRENEVGALRLENERRVRLAGYLIAAIIVAGLALLAWRHAAARRLLVLLREQTRATEDQRAALAAANAQLIQLNRVDALTGLASRGYGLERLAALLARSRALGFTPALLLFDLDHFKEINDRFGHPAGDQVLVAFAATLGERVPEDGLAARVGGEEFILMLEDADHDRALVLADAIRRRVRDLAVDVGPQQVRPSVSVGIALAPRDADMSVRELYAAADQALYAAKHAGRDCVRVHGAAG
jgi:diguanylate cyclase (GGDEF)-like protein